MRESLWAGKGLAVVHLLLLEMQDHTILKLFVFNVFITCFAFTHEWHCRDNETISIEFHMLVVHPTQAILSILSICSMCSNYPIISQSQTCAHAISNNHNATVLAAALNI